VDHAVPVFVSQRRKRRITGDARIVYHAVIRAVSLDVRLNNLAALRAVTDVKLHNAPLTAGFDDLLQGTFGACFIAVVVNRYQKTVFRQLNGNGFADPFAGAGD